MQATGPGCLHSVVLGGAGPAMAASVSSVIPVMMVFLVFQRQFIAALANSGLK
ncbi:hypothetical protein [Antribacter gilvus]|uniref:hypothetical protein n=1 Tax=Antribacter gilvus TaxID=2304675 RepID=UPI00198012FF|nr:hypothetical protein [Antribacter gilvus]